MFPSLRGKPLDGTAFTRLLKWLGIKAVPHGFRSSFRDWAVEETDHPPEVAEAALADVVRNQVEAAYRRTELVRPAAEVQRGLGRLSGRKVSRPGERADSLTLSLPTPSRSGAREAMVRASRQGVEAALETDLEGGSANVAQTTEPRAR